MTLATKRAVVSFYGGVGSVTGANFLLAGDKTRLLVDCGLIQGEKFAHDMNRAPFSYEPRAIDALLVTHAHIDHVGRIPKLVRDGFKGRIISTPATLELSRLMLPDAFSVMRSEAQAEEEFLYDEKDIERAFSLWETREYHRPFAVGEFEAVFKDSGHILGSAMCEITRAAESRGTDAEKRRKIVFTGDLGNSPSPLLNPAEVPESAAYLVMESVYGDRAHEGGERRKERLAEVIHESVKRGGTLLIPSFSLEKTQALLYELDDLCSPERISLARTNLKKDSRGQDEIRAGEEKKIHQVPVFLDSPLAIRITEVYRRHTEQFNETARAQIALGDDVFSFKNLHLTMGARESREVARAADPKIIIAGSGMSAGGRILEHERRYLGDSKNTILFIGYQAVGGLGRQIQEGVKKVRINGENVVVKARVETITGYSSHMDGEHLLEFARKAAEGETLEKVFVVMGEPKAALFLAQRIRDYHGIDTYVPVAEESVEIEL